jgi:hypothetical protein
MIWNEIYNEFGYHCKIFLRFKIKNSVELGKFFYKIAYM